MNCDYCSGDDDGFVTPLPKTIGKGEAHIFDSFCGAELVVYAPFHNKIRYDIKYCPMCGKKLTGKKVQDGRVD